MGLVLVHGRGATAEGILDLGHALALPDLALAAPQAPGMTWWPTSFLAPSAQMEPFVEQGMAAIDVAIEALAEEGLAGTASRWPGSARVDASRWNTRRGWVSLTAVLGLSAGLVGTGEAGGPATDALYGFGPKAFDYAARLDGVPVEITVHERDPHIPLARARESEGGVRGGLGMPSETRLSVTPGGAKAGTASVIGPEAVATMRGNEVI
jgi:phospholipase/carboxylesterase